VPEPAQRQPGGDQSVPDAAKHGLQHGERLPKFGTMTVG
jgi:hypothetical protein